MAKMRMEKGMKVNGSGTEARRARGKWLGGFAVFLAICLALGSGSAFGTSPGYAGNSTAGNHAGSSTGDAAGITGIMAPSLKEAVEDTAKYLLDTVRDPQVASIGGEWAVMGLARSGLSAPQDFYDKYYNNLIGLLKKNNGVLHDKKYTEYSRVVLALTAMGKDPADAGGYNLLQPLGDYEKVVWQGINGPVYALLALDSGGYEIPAAPGARIQATRDMYLDAILKAQLADGGFSLSGYQADPDVTGMALQALAKYQDRPQVKDGVEKALGCLSKLQEDNGGYTSWDALNSESTSQVLTALCELGVSPKDPRFVKNGMSLVDNILSYYSKGEGFSHDPEGRGAGIMATEQAFYALVSVNRVQSGKNSLYRMEDAKGTDLAGDSGQTQDGKGAGLPGKHEDIQAQGIKEAGKTFDDIKGNENQKAIEALAQRGIITGKSTQVFDPNATMKRSEYAAIVTRALGLTPKGSSRFRDVAASSWYAPYVGTANAYGIVNGTSETTFQPEGTITKEEAAVMTVRAAKLCGLESSMEEAEIRNMLAQFGDYTQASEWAKGALAFCYREGILSQEEMRIEPKRAIGRCEIAEMLYRMLVEARLI